MRLFKITDPASRTRGLQWGVGVRHIVPALTENPQLCSADVIHAYRDPDLALLMNPIQGGYDLFRLWEATGVPVVDDGTKVGVFSLTTIRELVVPAWWINASSRRDVQVRFAILAAESVLPIFEGAFPADKRPREAVQAARSASADTTDAAWTEEEAAMAAAGMAADVAVARKTDAADAAWAAATAARTVLVVIYSARHRAMEAARTAAAAVRAALYAPDHPALDLPALARQAVKEASE